MDLEKLSSNNSTCSHSSTTSLISILDNEVSSDFEISDETRTNEINNWTANIELSDDDISSLADVTDLVVDANNLEENENNHVSDKFDRKSNYLPHKDETNIYDNLTPWEKWVLTKAAHNRKIMSKREKEISSNNLKKELTKQLKEERQKKFEKLFALKVKEWNKDLAKNSLTKSSSKKLISTVPQEKIDENFKRWTERKLKNLKELRQLKKTEALEQINDDRNRQKRAKESYEAWLDKINEKNVSQRRSYASINGKRTGYYDADVYPHPAYINPNPWKS